MAVSVAAVAAKAAAAAVSSKQGRTAVATVVTAVLLPFMLAVVVVLSLLDGTTNHNVASEAGFLWRNADRANPTGISGIYGRYSKEFCKYRSVNFRD